MVAPYLLPENKKLTLNVKDIYIYDLSVFDPVVYNQQRCGNSYAFATVGTINLNNRIWHPSVPRVSPQHHTDCSRSYGNSGCNGGNFISSYQFAMYTGIESEIAYPINASALQLGVNQACRDSPATNYKISSYGSVLAENPSSSLCMNRINVLYNLHSMSTSMYAGFSVFMFYSGGVFVGCPQGNSDHAVQMVGFYLDTTTGYSHFKIKNSFGTNWGIGGYFYLISQNLCHICENSYLSL